MDITKAPIKVVYDSGKVKDTIYRNGGRPRLVIVPVTILVTNDSVAAVGIFLGLVDTQTPPNLDVSVVRLDTNVSTNAGFKVSGTLVFLVAPYNYYEIQDSTHTYTTNTISGKWEEIDF